MTANDKLRVLLLGSGGREHALAWKLAQASSVEHVFVFPGNGGTAHQDKISNITDHIDVTDGDYSPIVSLATQLNISLVVVGSDNLIVDGIGAYFRDSGIPCFCPSKEVAQLEGSKAFAKDFMQKYSIPTASYATFNLDDPTSLALAKAYVWTADHNVVIKASGLAAGKGVVIPDSKEEAVQTLNSFAQGAFGQAGFSVVIEEYLEGNEISLTNQAVFKNCR